MGFRFQVFDPADAPDPDVVYRNYVETCRRVSIEPVPRERARKLIDEWTDALAATTRAVPPPTH